MKSVRHWFKNNNFAQTMYLSFLKYNRLQTSDGSLVSKQVIFLVFVRKPGLLLESCLVCDY